MNYFYVALFMVLFTVIGSIFFAEWWNEKHGFDERGNPIPKPPSGKPGVGG